MQAAPCWRTARRPPAWLLLPAAAPAVRHWACRKDTSVTEAMSGCSWDAAGVQANGHSDHRLLARQQGLPLGWWQQRASRRCWQARPGPTDARSRHPRKRPQHAASRCCRLAASLLVRVQEARAASSWAPRLLRRVSAMPGRSPVGCQGRMPAARWVCEPAVQGSMARSRRTCTGLCKACSSALCRPVHASDFTSCPEQL